MAARLEALARTSAWPPGWKLSRGRRDRFSLTEQDWRLVEGGDSLGRVVPATSELITAVVQDALTGEILWLGSLPKESPAEALASGELTLELQGLPQRLLLRHLARSRDGGGLVFLVEGPQSRGRLDSLVPQSSPDQGIAPELVELERVLARRRADPDARSYTRKLLDAGVGRIGEKLVEEAGEVAQALASESDQRVAEEAADLVYHLMVGMLLRDVPFRALVEVLAKRSGTSGLVEKARRGKPQEA